MSATTGVPQQGPGRPHPAQAQPAPAGPATAALFEAVVRAALDCVVVADAEGRVLMFNPAAERTFGRSAADAVGRPIAELLVPPQLRAAHDAGFARHLATGERRILDRRVEITGMRADGSEFPVELTVTRVDLADGPVFAGHLRDITDRKQAEAELRASRARLVQAADGERRRLERDLHDGAQQSFLAAAVTVRRARRLLDDGARERLAPVLDDALEQLEGATAQLRALARGIHPAVLTDLGLVPALRALARAAPLPVEVEAEDGPRLPPPVETALYFVAAEALANVVRHAGAARAVVGLQRTSESVALQVRDDGAGGADPAAGSGLRGLAERLSALDGRLDVVSVAGSGSVVTATLPL